jgi:hypothetical protein
MVTYRNILLCCSAISLLLIGCKPTIPTPEAQDTIWEEIKGRNTDNPKREAIYRVKVPQEWIRQDPLPEESLLDTTKPLAEFIIKDEEGLIRIAIHNFPIDNPQQRIPPMAQVTRWQQQFSELDPTLSSTAAVAFNGYAGLLFTGVGHLKGQNEDKIKVIAFAMQLPMEHFNALLHPKDKSLKSTARQMRSDVTIKASGSNSVMEKHQEEIISFAKSLELIEEIPSG